MLKTEFPSILSKKNLEAHNWIGTRLILFTVLFWLFFLLGSSLGFLFWFYTIQLGEALLYILLGGQKHTHTHFTGVSFLVIFMFFSRVLVFLVGSVLFATGYLSLSYH